MEENGRKSIAIPSDNVCLGSRKGKRRRESKGVRDWREKDVQVGADSQERKKV